MRRMTPFDRDFADLHGRSPPEAEFIRHEDIRRGRIVSPVYRPGLRLVIGVLSLFWGGLLLVVVLAALAFVVMALWPA